MNKLIVRLIIMLLFSFNVNGQEKKEFKGGTITTTFNKEIIEYRFKSLVDLQDEIDIIIKEFDFSDSENKKTKECKVTIEVRVELLLGIATTSVSELIIVSCDETKLTDASNRFKAMLLAIIES